MTTVLDHIETLPVAGFPVTVLRLSAMGLNVLRWHRRQRVCALIRRRST